MSKRVILLIAALIGACAFLWHRDRGKIGIEPINTEQGYLAAQITEEISAVSPKVQRSRQAEWDRFVAEYKKSDLGRERRQVLDDDNGYFELEKMVEAYGRFRDQFETGELKLVQEMAEGKVDWDDEIVAHVLKQGEEVLAQFDAVLACLDFQIPQILDFDDFEPNFLLLVSADSALGTLKVLESEAAFRSDDLGSAISSTLEVFEYSMRLRRGDGAISEENMGASVSGEANDRLLKFLNAGGFADDKVILKEIFDMYSGSDDGEVMALEALRYSSTSRLELFGREHLHVGADLSSFRDTGLFVESGTEWPEADFKNAFENLDFGRVMDSYEVIQERLQGIARNPQLPATTLEEYDVAPTTGGEGSNMSDLSSAQFADKIALGMNSYVGDMARRSAIETAERRLLLLRVAQEAGFELDPPQDPFGDHPMQFDERTGEYFSVGYQGDEIRLPTEGTR